MKPRTYCGRRYAWRPWAGNPSGFRRVFECIKCGAAIVGADVGMHVCYRCIQGQRNDR